MNWEKNEDELIFFMSTASIALALKPVLKFYQTFFLRQWRQQHQRQKCWKKNEDVSFFLTSTTSKI